MRKIALEFKGMFALQIYTLPSMNRPEREKEKKTKYQRKIMKGKYTDENKRVRLGPMYT